MRILALCSLIVATAFALDLRATANAAAWCATYRSGAANCGFYTYEQCRAAVSGDSGFCNRNAFEADAGRPAARKERKAEPKLKRKDEKDRTAPAERAAPPPAASQPAPAPPAVVQSPVPALQPANNFQSARALILSGKYEAGIAAMKSLGYDDHPDVASSLGFANAKLGRFADARSWYDKALAADPNHLSTWGYSGALHVSQGELDKARADLARIKAICGGTGCREYQDLEGLIATKGR
jgi:tetratricopeptide (TPR) repeat protein